MSQGGVPWLLFLLVPGTFSEEQPGEYHKADRDADDGQPGADFIHQYLCAMRERSLGNAVQPHAGVSRVRSARFSTSSRFGL